MENKEESLKAKQETKEPEMKSYSSIYAKGEKCVICKSMADRKIGEIILDDNPVQIQHELTAYVCNSCFSDIFQSYSNQKREILPSPPKTI